MFFPILEMVLTSVASEVQNKGKRMSYESSQQLKSGMFQTKYSEHNQNGKLGLNSRC